MKQILTNIDIEKPDHYHKIGQVLLKPFSICFGHRFTVENGVGELIINSTIKRIITFVLGIVLFPLSFVCGIFGIILLRYSITHKNAYALIQKNRFHIIWNKHSPEIHSARLILRPIQSSDLPFYKSLFQNKIAMQRYLGGPRDITNRFQNWLARWNEDPFSALAVVERKTQKVIGHAIAGHGDYENNLNMGWSEMAYIIDPAYWNCDYKDEKNGIGTAGQKQIGLEVVRTVVAYIKTLKKLSIEVPCDVTLAQRQQIEENCIAQPNLKVHRNENGLIEWVYLPLKELRASSNKLNTGYKIIEQVFVKENGAQKFPVPNNNQRDLFILQT